MITPPLDGKAVLFWGCLLPEDPEKKGIFGRMIYAPTAPDHALLLLMSRSGVGIGWLRDTHEEMHYYLALKDKHLKVYDGIPTQVSGLEQPETVGDASGSGSIRDALELLGEDPEKYELGFFLGCGLF